MRRLLSLFSLIAIGWGAWYVYMTEYHGLPLRWSQITFDCEADEEIDNPIWDPAGDLRKAAEITHVKKLARKSSVSAAYRFTWQRSFHWPFVMTLEVLNDGTGKLHIQAWDGTPSRHPRQICERQEDGNCKEIEIPPVTQQVDKTVLLSSDQVNGFERLVVRNEFWNLANFSCAMFGLDGSNWTLEGATPAKYQFVKRWAPKDEDPIRQLGDWFLTESGMNLEPVY